MLVWGSKGETRMLEHAEIRFCPACERERTFRLVLGYTVHHVWYLFKWVTGKQYSLQCEVCRRGRVVEARSVESRLGRNPIPAATRFGGAALLALLAAGVTAAVVEGGARQDRTGAFLAAPQRGDLYVMNIASLVKNPESSGMYAVLRVRSASPATVEFDLPNVSYSKPKGAARDVSSGRAQAAEYYGPRSLPVAPAMLQQYRTSGELVSIARR